MLYYVLVYHNVLQYAEDLEPDATILIRFLPAWSQIQLARHGLVLRAPADVCHRSRAGQRLQRHEPFEPQVGWIHTFLVRDFGRLHADLDIRLPDSS